MQKYLKFGILAVVVIGVLYFLTRPTMEGLTSNPPVANPLPGQGTMAGQGASMMAPPPAPTSTGTTGLSSAPAPVTVPGSKGTVDDLPVIPVSERPNLPAANPEPTIGNQNDTSTLIDRLVRTLGHMQQLDASGDPGAKQALKTLAPDVISIANKVREIYNSVGTLPTH